MLRLSAFFVAATLWVTLDVFAQTTPSSPSAQRRPPLHTELVEWGLMYSNPKDPRAIAVDRKEVIPAKLGVTFGIIWTMTGYTGSRLVTYDFVLQHPPMPDAEGKVKTETRQTIYTNAINGSDQRQIGYRFENERERVAGDWSMSIWYDGKEVVSRRFAVVLPESESPKPSVSTPPSNAATEANAKASDGAPPPSTLPQSVPMK